MSISNLPEDKNITDFSDEELLLWLKDYVGGWASRGSGPAAHYEAVKTELTRRGNEKIFDLTKKLHKLTVILVVLTVVLVILTVVMIFK